MLKRKEVLKIVFAYNVIERGPLVLLKKGEECIRVQNQESLHKESGKHLLNADEAPGEDGGVVVGDAIPSFIFGLES